MRVDLPEPDGPMMAVNRPFSKATLTPRRATTWAFGDSVAMVFLGGEVCVDTGMTLH
jgi:hypothetical protein